MDDFELLSEYNSYLREKKEEGKKVIAFIAHDNIPEELIAAAGFIPLRLIFSGKDEFMNENQALNYLPASTCSFAQSCIGLFSLKPSSFNFLDLIDYFIISNHCVSDICTSEIISKYFFIPHLDFYVSYTHGETSIKYYKLELLEFKRQLENIKGSKISDEEITRSIKNYNNLKQSLREIDDLLKLDSEKLKIFQKALLFGPAVLPELEKKVEELKQKEVNLKEDVKHLILTGCSIFIGDYLNYLIEESGGNIIFYDTWIGWNYFSQILNDHHLKTCEDALEIFVERFKNNIYSDHLIPNYLENKISHLENYINKFKQKTGKNIGIINHIIKFCDHMSIFQALLKKELQKREIQVLNLERDYSRGSRGQLSTRIEAFLEMMK
ncbi:MAG: 2-hydroxyacyl-CoA dehydratase subunit D [Promethearchaeota archaeon]